MPRCGAKGDGCLALHSRHYCRLCEDKNSNHLSRNCPKGIILYHGTTVDAALSIIKEGFKYSTDGCWGPGIYFVNDEREAKKIAKHKARLRSRFWAVLECRVNLGKVYDWSSWEKSPAILKLLESEHKDHDSIKANHFPWAGVRYQFNEYCVRNHQKCNVLKMQREDGSFSVFGQHFYPVLKS